MELHQHQHDDVSLLPMRRGVAQPDASGRAELTEAGRLALRLPEERYVSPNVTIYPADDRSGCGVEFAGDAAGLTWLDREDALALARGILGRLEPAALVPRTFPRDSIPADASRAELIASARGLVDEERPHATRKNRLAHFAHGLLEGLNSTLEGLGYEPAALEEILPPQPH